LGKKGKKKHDYLFKKMIKKIYKLGREGREAIKNVSKQVGDILGKTLGPAGRNYFLPSGITNDGRTIVSEIRFEDECEDNVALAFHEMARQTDKDAGDGTTTTMVIGAQLALDCIDRVPDIDTPLGESKSSMELAKELEAEKDKVLEILKSKIIKVESLEDLRKVAYTAMEDKVGADIVAETMWQAGKDAYPILDNGFNGKIETSVVKGITLPFNIATASMFNGVGKVEYSEIPILVANHCFEQYLEIAPFILSMLQSKTKQNGLAIVAKQFSVPFINSVSDAVKRAGFPMVLISGNFHNDTFGDIAAFCDAKLIDTHPKTGVKIAEAKFNDAGFCKTFIAREKETTFIGGRGLESLVFGKETLTKVGVRVKEIEKLKETEKDGKERDLMDKRISALLGGIATIYVDAKTVAERYYLKLKVEDAMNSCKGALNDGMVKGGGATLKEIADELGETSLLYNALLKPYDRIIQNNLGKEFDLKEVYDSYLVVKAAVANAVSVVKVLITIEGIIANKEKDVEK